MKRLTVLVCALFVFAAPAFAAPPAERYVGRLAGNAMNATVRDGCLVLRRTDLCGWRVRLVTRSEMLGVDVADCSRWGRTCSYELAGATGERGVLLHRYGRLLPAAAPLARRPGARLLR